MFLKFLFFFSMSSLFYVLFFICNFFCFFFFSFFPDVEYRHGIDYKIICIHLPNSFFSYFFFSLLVLLSILYLFFFFSVQTYFFLFGLLGFISVFNCFFSGFFWGWSQWGSIPFFDFKISLIFILLLFFFICVLYLDYISFTYLVWFCFYVLYHIPLLKYNVYWFSEIHQQGTVYLFDIYLNNNTFFVLLFFFSFYFYFFVYVFLFFII